MSAKLLQLPGFLIGPDGTAVNGNGFEIIEVVRSDPSKLLQFLMVKRVLVVDDDPWIWRDVRRTLKFLADVHTAGDFPAARRRLFDEPPDLLVTNLRLGAYNGLHLVHLASTASSSTRSIVYSSHPDFPLIEEAQRIGAFFEWPQRLVSAMPAYVRSFLPDRDRRSPRQVDRRQLVRGGRRAADAVAPAQTTA
jgi:DNA-binding NtrC family response regulator